MRKNDRQMRKNDRQMRKNDRDAKFDRENVFKVWPGKIAKIGQKKWMRTLQNSIGKILQNSAGKNGAKFGRENYAKESKHNQYLLWILRAASIGYKCCKVWQKIVAKFDQKLLQKSAGTQLWSIYLLWTLRAVSIGLQFFTGNVTKFDRETIAKFGQKKWLQSSAEKLLRTLPAIGRLLEVFSMSNKFEPVRRFGPRCAP